MGKNNALPKVLVIVGLIYIHMSLVILLFASDNVTIWVFWWCGFGGLMFELLGVICFLRDNIRYTLWLTNKLAQNVFERILMAAPS